MKRRIKISITIPVKMNEQLEDLVKDMNLQSDEKVSKSSLIEDLINLALISLVAKGANTQGKKEEA